MIAPVCAITGASGFGGKALAQHFQKRGWNVIALVRNTTKAPPETEPRRFVLGEPVKAEMFTGVDVLVHAAHDFSLYRWSDICRVNVVGSDYVFDAATRAGVKRQIFLSSLSAFEGCRSYYGRGKLASEEAVRIRGGVSVRPGMLYGGVEGGMAGKIAAAARQLPIVPLIGSGKDAFYTCHIDDLCNLVLRLTEVKKISGRVVTAANAAPVTMRDLVKTAKGGTTTFLPLPWHIIAGGLWLAERTGFRPAFRSDSVVSFANSNPEVDFTGIEELNVRFRPFGQD